MTTNYTCPAPELLLFSKTQEHDLLHSLLLTLQRLRHTSEHMQWVEQAICDYNPGSRLPTTDLTLKQVVQILQQVRNWCPKVAELFLELCSSLTQAHLSGTPQRQFAAAGPAKASRAA